MDSYACVITIQATRSDRAIINTSWSEVRAVAPGTSRLQVMNQLADKALINANLIPGRVSFSITFFYMEKEDL